jgi:hypothetical protein
MTVQIFTDEELKKLLRETGFVLNVDYPTKDIIVHRTSCKHVNPVNPNGIRPSSKSSNNTGEFWYSNSREDILRKVREISQARRLKLRFCRVCDP